MEEGEEEEDDEEENEDDVKDQVTLPMFLVCVVVLGLVTCCLLGGQCQATRVQAAVIYAVQ